MSNKPHIGVRGEISFLFSRAQVVGTWIAKGERHISIHFPYGKYTRWHHASATEEEMTNGEF